jgi:hypothetical protein
MGKKNWSVAFYCSRDQDFDKRIMWLWLRLQVRPIAWNKDGCGAWGEIERVKLDGRGKRFPATVVASGVRPTTVKKSGA